MKKIESTLAHNVVLNLLLGFEGKHHVIIVDNYFISIVLSFKSLLKKEEFMLREHYMQTIWTFLQFWGH